MPVYTHTHTHMLAIQHTDTQKQLDSHKCSYVQIQAQTRVRIYVHKYIQKHRVQSRIRRYHTNTLRTTQTHAVIDMHKHTTQRLATQRKKVKVTIDTLMRHTHKTLNMEDEEEEDRKQGASKLNMAIIKSEADNANHDVRPIIMSQAQHNQIHIENTSYITYITKHRQYQAVCQNQTVNL